MARKQDDQDNVRRYLLRQLSDAEQQDLELRFFSDDELAEELEIVEDELIDEYLAGELSETEHAGFEQYFLAHPERKRKLAAGEALQRYFATATPDIPPAPEPELEPGMLDRLLRWLRSTFSSPPVVALAMLVLVVLSFGIWRGLFSESDVDKGLIALNAAYKQSRPVEARLTRSDYAPFVSTRGAPVPVNTLERDRAERFLQDAVDDHPNAASYHALGKYYLWQKDLDKGIHYFEEAQKADPNNAQVYADLGAAYLEKGKKEIDAAQTEKDQPTSGAGMEDLARSQQNLNKALELDRNLLEPLFNRAFVHKAMGLLPQAAEDLKTYIQKDPNSKWADEARQNLKLIEQDQSKASKTGPEILQEFLKQHEASDEEAAWTTVSSYQNRSGNVVVEPLLDSFLENAAAGRKEEADRALELLRYVGDLELRKAGDRFYFDLVRFYESATPEQQSLAAKARDLMKQGHAGWGRIDVKENLSLFTDARELFEQAGNFPESRFADFWISFCHFRDHDQGRSRQVLDPLLLICENRSYSWLQSRGLHLLSAIQFDLNEHSKAIDFALQSVRVAERINDSVALLNATDALVEYYRYLGNYTKSLAFIQKGLALLSAKPLDPIQAARHNGVVALALTTIGFHDAAAGYQKEALRLAVETGITSAKANNYSFMGLINGRLRNFAEAMKDAQLGFDMAQPNASQPAGRGLMAYAALQMGNVQKDAGDCDKAIPYYTQSIELYLTFADFQTHLYQAHKGRLFCYLQKQNDPLAQQEIATMLDLMEKYRRKISGENNRNTFFDVEHNVFDAAIEFEYSRMKDREQAFRYLNSAQARSLLDLLNADKDVRARVQDADIKFQAVSEPLTLEQIRDRLSDHEQLIQYAVLEDRILIWIISHNDFQVREKQIARKSLNEKLLHYLNLISHPPTGAAGELELGKELYSVLVQPVESLLDKNKLLCIVPDGTLNYLPFASLVSPSGKYFFEQQQLMTSPSASVFLNCSDNAQRKSDARDERVLAVGNPRFDRKAYPELDDLPAAAAEAVEIGKLYNSRTALVGAQATAAAVKNEVEGADVVHLALHYSIDDEVPLRSKLLLAAAPREAAHASAGAPLYSFEIYNLRLPKTRLVVLSSCQSGAERNYSGEGVMSLARAFIGAGVPLVVASLWPVDSAATKELMVSFHKHRHQEGASTVAALTKAQQDLLHGSSQLYRHPYYWAAFTVNGGASRF